MQRTREDLAAEVVALRDSCRTYQHELDEAHSEIRRHHVDFERVQAVYEMMDSIPPSGVNVGSWKLAIGALRDIVG